MTKRQAISTIAMVCVLSLAACSDNSAEEDPAAQSASTSADTPANWNAADACSILNKAAVAKALEQEVKETHLSLVHEAGAIDAATSECTYTGAEGSSIASLMTRWSPINDNTQSSIVGTRNAAASALKSFSDKQIEDVPGLGKAAFFTPGIDSLTVFFDDARMITLNVQKVPEGKSGKDVAVMLAKDAGA